MSWAIKREPSGDQRVGPQNAFRARSALAWQEPSTAGDTRSGRAAPSMAPSIDATMVPPPQ